MAVTDWWLGENGSGWATVVCRANSNDVVTVGCNGQSFTATPDTTVKDGIVNITVTGVGEARVAYTVDGVDGGTLRGLRTTGELTIASGSCWYTGCPDHLAEKLLRDYDLDMLVILGDFPYANSSWTMYGETTVGTKLSIANAKNAANYLAHHRQVRQIPGIKELKRNVPTVYMADDHEYVMDNACNDLTWWQTCPAESQPLATQEDLTVAWAAARAAITAYTTGNPVNTDAGIDADALYTRKRVSDALEWFLCDCIHYRSAITAADDASKTMLGANQKAWLIDSINNSTAALKMVFMPKQLFKGGGNDDCWFAESVNPGYQTELKEILYAIKDATGVFFVAGDQHRFNDQQIPADFYGAGYPAISCLVGCPTTVPQNTTSVAGYPDGVVYRDNGPNTEPGRSGLENVYAILKVNAGMVDRYLLSTERGLIPRGYIEAGSNAVTYPQARFG